VEERGTQRAWMGGPAIGHGGSRGAVAHDRRAKLHGRHVAASGGLVGREWGLEGGLGRCGRWHLEADVAVLRGLLRS
jgi:hypothetical protein